MLETLWTRVVYATTLDAVRPQKKPGVSPDETELTQAKLPTFRWLPYGISPAVSGGRHGEELI